MLTINNRIILIIVSAFSFANIALGGDVPEPNFTDFYQAIESDSDKQAVQAGQEIFERIEKKYRSDAGFGALKSKLVAAEFLANQMIGQLKKATGRQIFDVAGELFENKEKSKNSLSVAPAKSFYETSRAIFLKPVNISELEAEEKKFLSRFYNLKLRIMISSIAKAGHALAIAETSFKGTYDYVLVLPFLHTSETGAVNNDVLAPWMRQSDQLKVFSDSSLLHYGFVYHAQAFARAAAKLGKEDFSQEDFYRSASKKCGMELPHVAVDCLKRAIELIDEKNVDERIGLQFDIIQIWLDSANAALAAGEAKSIADSFPDHTRSGDAIWLHFYALSRAGNVESILANIDAAISNPSCSDYRAKLMYMKWWALRKQKDRGAAIAALEHQLITDYGDDVMVAPIMLSHATDLLAGQDYAGALATLNLVQEKFPSSKAAKQAEKMTQKAMKMQEQK